MLLLILDFWEKTDFEATKYFDNHLLLPLHIMREIYASMPVPAPSPLCLSFSSVLSDRVVILICHSRHDDSRAKLK